MPSRTNHQFATYARQWDNTGGTGSGLDALGNWTAATTDTNGGGTGGATTQTHSVNSRNQLTAVSGLTSPVYDNNGAITTDENNYRYTYDAWGDAITVKTSAGLFKSTYTVDALGRRVAQTIGTAGVGSSTQYFFSKDWQIVEEHEVSTNVIYQNVWSPVYVDALVERDTVDPTTAGHLDLTFNTTGEYTDHAGHRRERRPLHQARRRQDHRRRRCCRQQQDLRAPLPRQRPPRSHLQHRRL